MECPDCFLTICQIIYWFLCVILMSLIIPFDQVLESLSAVWCLKVYNIIHLMDVWIIHVSANNRAWVLIILARNWVLSCRA